MAYTSGMIVYGKPQTRQRKSARILALRGGRGIAYSKKENEEIFGDFLGYQFSPEGDFARDVDAGGEELPT